MTGETSAKAPSLGRKIAGVVGKVVVGLVVLVAAFAGFVFWKSERGMAQHMRIDAESLVVPSGPDAIERGRRLAGTRGCMECHGADGGGMVFIRALPVMEVRTPNITPGGPTARYSGRDWARAVRHGVRPDGSMILFMPIGDFRFLDDQDLGAIVAYLKSLPPVRRDVGRTFPGPVGRMLYVTGELPLVPAEIIDHDAPIPPTPAAAPTAEYGAYLARACTGCHGEHFSGGKIPGTPPDWPPAANITPDRATGLGGATEEEFVAALTQGTRRAGGTINPMHMPWRQLRGLTPDERRALWLYLRTVPTRPAGQR